MNPVNPVNLVNAVNPDLVRAQLRRLLDRAGSVDAAVVVTTDGLFAGGVSRDDAFDQATFETFSAVVSALSACAREASLVAANAVASRQRTTTPSAMSSDRPGEIQIRLGITGVQVVTGPNAQKGWLTICPLGDTAWLALFAADEPNFGTLGNVIREVATTLADMSSPAPRPPTPLTTPPNTPFVQG